MVQVSNDDNSIYRDIKKEYYDIQKQVMPEYELERRVQDNDDPYMRFIYGD